MKLTKSDLKSVVKECLVEILNEGLAGSLYSQQRPSSNPLQHASRQRFPESKSSSTPTPQLKEAVKRESGGNKVMESIFADTAALTLPKMLEGDRKGYSPPSPGGVVEQVVASTTPEDLFGEDVASKWADLAFSSSPKK